MRNIVISISFILASVGSASAQMTDEQVIQYTKQAYSQGMSNEQIASALISRGVTQGQILRIKNNAEGSRALQADSAGSGAGSAYRSRGLTHMGERDTVATRLQDRVQDHKDNINNDITIREVFGRNIFNSRNLTFEPSLNIPTPENYLLGPGDEVIIDVWGVSEATIRQQISPEGSIMIANIGPVYLNGMTVAAANAMLQKKLQSIYAGMSSDEPASQIKLSLGRIRSIQVNVMGEVATPGTYTLPSLASVFHALYSAGGVNDIGSLRTVRVFRGGRQMAVLDVYEYIMKGKLNDDIRLMDGDIIMVPPYENLVQAGGSVKRPMFYEMRGGETVGDILEYAGGFAGNAYRESLSVTRKGGRENQIFTVGDDNYDNFVLVDGDVVNVGSILPGFENRVQITGAVYREGFYELGAGVETVRGLIGKADGLRGDAFLNRAVLTREKPDFSLEVIPVDIARLMRGEVADIPLQKNDMLYIPSVHDINEEGALVVHGEVAAPGRYRYADNMTIEDLIIQAGGLLESASMAKVDVARRIRDPRSSTPAAEKSKVFTFDLKDGYLLEGDRGFVLQPFDEIYVRRSPGYQAQQNVEIMGEVVFGGTYALTGKTERLSDLVKKAGGLKPEAYVKGARLVRMMNEFERMRLQTTRKLADMSRGADDSISVAKLDLSDSYYVGIDLEMAMAKPGSDYDLILREGDRIFVPGYNGTVRLSGAVMYPNTVMYKKGWKLKDYISQAGGFGQDAKRSRLFVVYMNGTVSKTRGNRTVMRPGCEIVVPSKTRRRMSTSEVLGITTSATSMAAVIASLVNIISK